MSRSDKFDHLCICLEITINLWEIYFSFPTVTNQIFPLFVRLFVLIRDDRFDGGDQVNIHLEIDVLCLEMNKNL